MVGNIRKALIFYGDEILISPFAFLFLSFTLNSPAFCRVIKYPGVGLEPTTLALEDISSIENINF